MYRASVNRRAFASVVVSVATAVAVPPAWSQAKPEQSRVSIAVGGKGAFYYLPLTIAEQLGFFKAEGLDVDIMDVAGGVAASQAVQAGVAQVAAAAYEHTIQLQAKGQFYQAFVLQGRAPQIAMGVSTKTMRGYKTLSDLRGKKIGVSEVGASTHMVASLVLARAGIHSGEVNFVGVGTSGTALTALRSGQIDALCNVDPVMTMLEQKGDVRIVTDTRTLKGTQAVFGGLMPAGCLYAPAEYLKKNPVTAQALTHAMVRSLKWLQTAGPSDLIKAVPEAYLLGDRALYLASFNKVREAIATDGLIPEEGCKVALRAVSSFDASLQADKINLARTFTNEFAKKAKDRFKA